MSKSASEILIDVETELRKPLSADRLRDIRSWLDHPAFLVELTRYASTLNDPETLNELINRLYTLKRSLEDLRRKRDQQKDFASRTAIGGGIGLVTGSLIAVAHLTFPPIALISLVGGTSMLLMGYFRADQLDEERHLYGHLADRVGEILKEVRDAK